jgi:hypothetical protein
MIISQGRLCRVANVYFEEEPECVKVDIVHYIQRASPVPDAYCSVFCTIVIDLGREPEALLAGMHRNTRNEIRHGMRKGLRHLAWRNHPVVLEHACDFYDRFAVLKGLPPADRRYLRLLAAAGQLDLSVVRDGDRDLVWHVYYRTPQRVLNLISASLFMAHAESSERALIGIANRYHTWMDILMFRQAGIPIFDQGGWYDGTTDQEKLRINNFKERFGGTIIRNFDCHRALTLKGTLTLEARGLLNRLPVDRWKLELLVRRALPRARRQAVAVAPAPVGPLPAADYQPCAEEREKHEHRPVERALLEPVLHAQADREAAEARQGQRH